MSEHEWSSRTGSWWCDRCGVDGGSGTVPSTSHALSKCQGFVHVLSRVQCSECPALRARLAAAEKVVEAAEEVSHHYRTFMGDEQERRESRRRLQYALRHALDALAAYDKANPPAKEAGSS